MSRRSIRWMILVLALALLVGCAKAVPTAAPTAPAQAPPTEAPAPTAEAATEAVLLVNDIAITQSQIEGLDLIEIVAESKGEKKAYEGYSMLAVLELAGAEGQTLTMIADDGHSADVAIADLNPECIIRIRTKGGFSVTLPGQDSSTWIKGVVEWQVTGKAPVASIAASGRLCHAHLVT